MSQLLFIVIVLVVGGREGKVILLDYVFEFDVVMLGILRVKKLEKVINLEQLFVVGYVVCFDSVFQFVVRIE